MAIILPPLVRKKLLKARAATPPKPIEDEPEELSASDEPGGVESEELSASDEPGAEAAEGEKAPGTEEEAESEEAEDVDGQEPDDEALLGMEKDENEAPPRAKKGGKPNPLKMWAKKKFAPKG